MLLAKYDKSCIFIRSNLLNRDRMSDLPILSNTLFTDEHICLLTQLFKSSCTDFSSMDHIYERITKDAVIGLNVDRAGYWILQNDKLVCLKLYDQKKSAHIPQDELLIRDLPHYIESLQNGIAIVANDATADESTKELNKKYLLPLGITDLLDLPIRENGVLIGVLCCEHYEDARSWTKSEIAFGRAVADVLTLWIEQHRRRQAEIAIEKLYDDARKMNEKLLDFTYIISHNVRSNTSNMSMIIDLIDDTTNLTEKQEYIDLLRESNNKLLDTIHFLNETVNIQIGAKINLDEIEVKSTIENSLSGINAIIKKQKAKIKINVDEHLLIKTVPSYFESILFNLITNAIKYRHPERSPKIEITANKIDEKVEICVRDNGLGIDLIKNKNKIFGMYKTFHGNTDAVGLGLFMSKNHAEALGGCLDVESILGEGSTFKLTL